MDAPRRIAFINEKGGSAKTTLVASIGTYLAQKRGHRVLGVDMDPQGQLGKVLGIEVRRRRQSAIDLLLDSVLGDAALDHAPPSRNRLPICSTASGMDVIVSKVKEILGG